MSMEKTTEQTNIPVLSYRQVTPQSLIDMGLREIYHNMPERRGSHIEEVFRSAIYVLWFGLSGNVMQGSVRMPQQTLASRAGIGRRWCHTLLERLRTLGLLDWDAPWGPDGVKLATHLRAGPKLQHIFLRISYANRPRQKVRANTPTPSSPQFFPTKRKKKVSDPVEEPLKRPPEWFLHRSETGRRFWERQFQHG